LKEFKKKKKTFSVDWAQGISEMDATNY